jgi:hypothetical protein
MARIGFGKGGFKGKKGQKKLLMYGAIAAGAYFLFFRKKPAAATPDVQLSLKPAPVKAGEFVSAATYRVIEGKRPGLKYALVQEGGMGGTVKFTPNVTGNFTRNIAQEGGSLFAELEG